MFGLMWERDLPKIRLFGSYLEHIPPQGSHGLAPRYNLGDQSRCLTLGPWHLSHHSPCSLHFRNASCHFQRVIHRNSSASRALRVCNSYWSRGVRAGDIYVGGHVYCVCLCVHTHIRVLGYVVKVGSRAETANSWDGLGWRRQPGNQSHLSSQCLR